jgi:hypothetical protein
MCYFYVTNSSTKSFETSNEEVSSIKINKGMKLYAYSLHEGMRCIGKFPDCYCCNCLGEIR